MERAEREQDLGWGSLLSMGITVGAAIAVGLAAGWLVDHLAGTTPVFLLVGLALGIVAAVAFVVTKFRAYLKT